MISYLNWENVFEAKQLKNLERDKMTNYSLEIKPALEPSKRHEIEECLEQLGYKVEGGGTWMDNSSCDISFSDE
jgi:hypothetical protein